MVVDLPMPKINVLVEGQTEETFVRDVLNPHFMGKNSTIYLNAIIIQTKRVLNGGKWRGGVTTYRHFRDDARRLIADSGALVITSMIDLYKLPADFPGFAASQSLPLRARVKFLESALSDDLDCERFLPYISTHEFESLVLADPRILADVMGASESDLRPLREQVDSFESPEHVNGTVAPSDRIISCLPSYDKVRHGPISTARIGLRAIASQCLHFSEWVNGLENLTAISN